MQQPFSDVRPSPIAGQWYPGNPARLATAIDEMVDRAPETEIAGRVVGLLAPHAGYIYSGPIAACAYKLVRGLDFRRVIVISPMHHPHVAPVLTSEHQAYHTPLGDIPVDHEALDALRKEVPLTAIRNDPEHSLEIELPFLQRVLAGPFSLVPLMLRDQSYATAQALGEALAGVADEEGRTLLVASSDLSHFYTDEQARQLDRVMLDRVAAFDPEGVIRVEDEERAFACGRGAIAAMLVAARALGADQVQIVAYGTSADTSGDTKRVVGYSAAAAYQSRA